MSYIAGASYRARRQWAEIPVQTLGRELVPPGRLHSGHPGIQFRAGVTAQRQALRPDGLRGRVHPGLPARGAGGRGRLAGLRDVQPLGRRRPSSAGHADDVRVHVRACRRCYALAGLSQAAVYNTGTMEHSPGRGGPGDHPRLRRADQRSTRA